MTARSLGTLLVAVLVQACTPTGPDGGAPDAGPSPNVSFQPSPIATSAPGRPDASPLDGGPQGLTFDASGRPVLLDAGAPPPVPIEPQRAIPPEDLPRTTWNGAVLEGRWGWRDVPSPPAAEEVFAAGIDKARAKTLLTWSITVADAGRMSILFTSDAMPLAKGASIRKRADRLGSIVLWPQSTSYRAVSPGSLRTVLGERRVDVTPLSPGRQQTLPKERRLDLDVRVESIASSLGTARLSLAQVPEVGTGGPLLCRALLELVGVDPATLANPVCVDGEVPLHAVFDWQAGGGVTFEVTSIARRNDLDPGGLLVPPPGAAFEETGLPASPAGIFLSREDLQGLRTRDVALPDAGGVGAPGEGFVAQNGTSVLMYFLLDGVPVVMVPPLAERFVVGPRAGAYLAQWRTFLGERVEPPLTVSLPARVTVGVPDAGAPDAG